MEKTEITSTPGSADLFAGAKKASKLCRLVPLLVLVFMVVAGTNMLVRSQASSDDFSKQQERLAKFSTTIASKQISRYVKELKDKAHTLSLEIEDQINRKTSSRNQQTGVVSDGVNGFGAVIKRTMAMFPNAVNVVVANAKGEILSQETEGFSSDYSRKAIAGFAVSGLVPGIIRHRDSGTGHFDIIVSVKPESQKQFVLLASFSLKEIGNILTTDGLANYSFFIQWNDSTGVAEYKFQPVSTENKKVDDRNIAENSERTLYSDVIVGTAWKLGLVVNDARKEYQVSPYWITSNLITMLFVCIGLFLLMKTGRSAKLIETLNNRLLVREQEFENVALRLEEDSKIPLKLLDRMSSAFIQVDNDWMIMNANNEAEQFIGMPLDEIIGKNFWDVKPELVSLLYKLLNKSKVLKIDVDQENYYTFMDKWFCLQTSQHQSGINLVFQDITARKVQNTAMHESEARFRAIFNSATAGIITIDEHNCILSFNPGAESLLGYKSEEITGKPLSLILPQEHKDNHSSYIKKYIRAGVKNFIGTTRDLTAVRKDGQVISIEVSIGEAVVDSKYMFTAVIQDVSRRKEAELKSRESILAKMTAENASKAKSTFLANMSHEIRTPLTAIIGFGESLQRENLKKSTQKDSVNSIVNSGHHLLTLINDILDISKIEAGKFELDLSEVDPVELVGNVVDIVKPQAKVKGLSFTVNYQFPLPKSIKTDFVRLKQVIINLCSNALKFTAEGYVTINVKSDIEAQSLIIEVVDSGIGMDDTQIDKIFSAFTQADSSTTRKYGGTGLGLSLSQQLTSMLGGAITVTSKRGVGSCFSVSVDTGKIDTANLINDSSSMPFYKKNSTPEVQVVKLEGRVLLAEDNEINQRLLMHLLKTFGVKADAVENGVEAIEACKKREYDLVYMDMQMPVMGGVEAVNQLRSMGYTTPIVALTANATEHDKVLCLESGCEDFVTKPVTIDHFYQVTQQYLPRAEIDGKSGDGKDSRSDGEKNNPENIDPEKEPGSLIYSMLLVDEPDFADLLEKFIDELPLTREAIHKDYNDGDWDNLKITVHKLKGCAGSYGYQMLTDLSFQMERSVADKDYTGLKGLLDEFDDMLERITEGYIEQTSGLSLSKNGSSDSI